MANKAQSALSGAASGAAAGAALGSVVPGIGNVVGAVGGGIIGGLGSLLGGGPSEAEKAAAQAVEDLQNNYDIPPLEARRIVYERYKEIGALTPEMEQAILAEPTAFEKVTVDPSLGAAQKQALANIQNKMNQGGLDLNDLADLQTLQLQTAQAARGRDEAIQQQMQQRGMGGAGAELAARLSASQAGADQASQRALAIAAQAQRNKAEQINQSFNMARNMSQDELNRAESLAKARDVNQQFNVGQQTGAQQRNVASKNRAGELTWNNKQSTMDKNTGVANQQRLDDRAATLGYSEAKNKKLADIANARNAQAIQSDQSSAANAQGWNNALTGIGAGVVAGKKAGLWGTDEEEVKKKV